MKAIIWTDYGPPEVFQLEELEKPVPKDNEILIRIYATTVTAGDSELRRLDLPFYITLPMRMFIGFGKPKENTIPGTELAGEIEAIGKDVVSFNVGDKVFGSTGTEFGTNAEYICLPEVPGEMEGSLALMPSNMTYAEAATVPFGGRDALHFLRFADLQDGDKILINGAGGSIGTFAVQLAKHFGTEVTAIDNADKLDMLRSIGADHVIDYTKEDFTKNGEVYDVIFDVVGTISLSGSKNSLKPEGIYLLANPIRGQMMSAMWTRMTTKYKVFMQTASGSTEDLDYLRELIEAGVISTVIDRTYPLEEIIEAHRYVDTGAKQGNVVITIED